MVRKEQNNKRYNWLADMINSHKFSIGAEVGARKGATTGYILQNCSTLKRLYVADLWDIVPSQARTAYWNEIYGHVSKNRFANMQRHFDMVIAPYRNHVTVLQGLSWEVAENVEDGSLDFVFIDADHAYESVYKDIDAWAPKLKPYGILCGHDINIDGVRHAVRAFTIDHAEPGIDNCWYCSREYVII